MQDIFLYDFRKEAKERIKNGRTKEDLKADLMIVNPLYKVTKDYTYKQLPRLLNYLSKGISKSDFLSMTYTVRFRLKKGGPIFQELISNFIFDLVLLTPILEKGLELDKNYLLYHGSEDKEWEWTKWSSKINSYIDKFYLDKHKDSFTREEMSEAIYFVRACGDRIADTMGPVLMQSISLHDFIDTMQRDQRARDIMMVNYPLPNNVAPKVIENLAKEKTNELKAVIDQDPGGILHTVTEFSNMGQFKEMAVLMGYKPDLYGSTIPITSATNNIKGFADPVAAFVDASGGRKAEVIKLKVAEAGTFERCLALVTADLKDVDPTYVCNSKHMLRMNIEKAEQLKELHGRFYLFDKDDPKEAYKVINAPKDKGLIGKTIYLKTPITCSHPKRREGIICRGCYSEALVMTNERLHIGAISAYSAADSTQQKSLSAKHNLITNTHNLELTSDFEKYFVFDGDNIVLSEKFLNELKDGTVRPGGDVDPEYLDRYYFRFDPKVIGHIKKSSHKFNKNVPAIVIYDKVRNENMEIRNESESRIFMGDEIADIYKSRLRKQTEEQDVLISITDLCKTFGSDISLFYIDYKNVDISEPISDIASTFASNKMEAFTSYEEAIAQIVPLFKAAGIRIPQIHIEILLSRLIRTDMKDPYIDWTQNEVPYQMLGYKKALKYSGSAVISMIFENLKEHLDNKYGLYDRTGGSIYDPIIKS